MTDTLILNSDGMPIRFFTPAINWRDAIKMVYLDEVSVLDVYDDWEVHSPSTTIKVPAVVMVREYVTVKNTVKFSRDMIFLRDRYICQYCGERFMPDHLTLDHVMPRCFGGRTSWDNLSSACEKCNGERGHNIKIQPMKKPWVPSLWEMVKLRKEFPLYIPHESWGSYLDWPKENLVMREKPKIMVN